MYYRTQVIHDAGERLLFPLAEFQMLFIPRIPGKPITGKVFTVIKEELIGTAVLFDHHFDCPDNGQGGRNFIDPPAQDFPAPHISNTSKEQSDNMLAVSTLDSGYKIEGLVIPYGYLHGVKEGIIPVDIGFASISIGFFSFTEKQFYFWGNAILNIPVD
jgi:hypothetical protein